LLNVPLGQGKEAFAFGQKYPGAQDVCVGEVDPAEQKYPIVQFKHADTFF